MGAWIPLIAGLVILALCIAVPFVVPKGPNSEYYFNSLPLTFLSVIKTSVVAALICCYLMYKCANLFSDILGGPSHTWLKSHRYFLPSFLFRRVIRAHYSLILYSLIGTFPYFVFCTLRAACSVRVATSRLPSTDEHGW